MEKTKSFSKIIIDMSRKHGLHKTFSDFLTLTICAFSLGRMEDLYMETINKYEKPDAYRFSEALSALIIEMMGDGFGLVDILGEFYEQNLSHGHNGQFFTPQPICDLMARMINPTTDGKRIADPACGSGRLLMAMAKVNRLGYFYGADVDVTCAKMTVINLCLNGMFGEVAWMDSLTNRFYMAWEIFPTIKGCPCIKPIPKELSYIHLKLPENKTPLPNTNIHPNPAKQLIFEF